MDTNTWDSLQPGDKITLVEDRMNSIQLVARDHIGRWIGYLLSVDGQPMKSVTLTEKPEIWKRSAT